VVSIIDESGRWTASTRLGSATATEMVDKPVLLRDSATLPSSPRGRFCWCVCRGFTTTEPALSPPFTPLDRRWTLSYYLIIVQDCDDREWGKKCLAKPKHNQWIFIYLLLPKNASEPGLVPGAWFLQKHLTYEHARLSNLGMHPTSLARDQPIKYQAGYLSRRSPSISYPIIYWIIPCILHSVPV